MLHPLDGALLRVNPRHAFADECFDPFRGYAHGCGDLDGAVRRLDAQVHVADRLADDGDGHAADTHGGC